MIYRTEAAILGGGPAGATAALLLARARVPVLVLESGARRSHIGETLPASAAGLLKRLGVWSHFLPQKHAPSFGNVSAWGASDLHESNSMCNPDGPAWRLDRTRFDAMLRLSARDAGAVWLEPAMADNVRRTRSGGWEILVKTDLGECTVEANLIMDATGRASWFARSNGAFRTTDDRLCGFARILDPAPAFKDTRTLVEARPDGWWYSGTLAGGAVVAIYFTDSDLPDARKAATGSGWINLLDDAPHTRARFRFQLAADRPRVMAANSSILTKCAGDKWVAVGDAAASYDPLSSQGIVHALSNSELAAHAAHQFLAGQIRSFESYQRVVERAFAVYRHNHRAFYRVEGRWPDRAFWQRRQNSSTISLITESKEHLHGSVDRQALQDISGNRHRASRQ